MDTALLLARVLLAAVFALAGVAKLADRGGSGRTVANFGVPAALAGPLGILLPLAELAVAAALIFSTTAWWGALGAAGLLVLFMAGIGANLARGRRPDCHCFGQLHSAPAGWLTLARNGALGAVAAFVVWEGRAEAGPSALSWLGGLMGAQLLGFVVAVVVLGLVAAQWLFLFNLLRQNGRLLVRLAAVEERLAEAGLAPEPSENGSHQAAPGLPVGARAPSFSLRDLGGEEVTLDHLRAAGKPVVLIFVDPDCGPCAELWPEVGRWQREQTEKLTIALVSQLSAEENRAKVANHGVHNILLQRDWEVAEAYRVLATPTAVIVSPEGTIDSPLGEAPDGVEDLVARAVRPPTVASTLAAPRKIGEAAPEFELPDLEGRTVSLGDFKGEQTLLLFWSPECGFCQEMLPDLKAWEANPSEGAPRLLVISDGDEEANSRMEVRSRMLLDGTYTVSDAFGVEGTPSAVLVDAEGNIASKVAAGAPEVLALARAGRASV